MERIKSQFPALLAILATYRIIVSTMPAVAERSSTIINIGTLLLTYLYVFNYLGFTKGKAVIISYIPLFLLFIADTLFGSTGMDSNIMVLLYKLLQAFLWPLIIYCLVKTRNKSFGVYLLLFFLICTLYTCATTCLGNIQYPGASRALARLNIQGDVETEQMFRSLNIGGVDFIYQLVLMIPLLVYTIRNESRWLLLIVVPSMVAFIMTIIISEYTTALIFTFASAVLIILPKKINLRRFVFISIALIFVLLLFVYVFDIFGFLADLFNDRTGVSARLQDISNMLHGIDTSGGDLEKRGNHWMKSVNEFLSSPLYGTGKEGGHHSYLLDHLAKYGLIGGAMLLVVYKSIFSLVVKRTKFTPFEPYIYFVFWVEIALTLLNPYLHVIVFTLIVPLFIIIFQNTEKEKICIMKK